MDLGQGSGLTFFPALLTSELAVMAALLDEVPLRVETLRIGSRAVNTPRQTAHLGDPGCRLRYSGRTFEPSPMTPTVSELRALIAGLTGLDFNAVLINFYRDGRDSMGWHADDEPELLPHAPDDLNIFSLSLGARRRFVLRHRSTGVRHVFELGEGDGLLMRGATQRDWQHAVPKTTREVGPRLNLTFRQVRPGHWGTGQHPHFGGNLKGGCHSA